MRADRDTFIEQTRQMDRDALFCLAVSLYDELVLLRLLKMENERISTEAYIQFSELDSKYAAAVRENGELKKLLEKETEKNALKTKSIFGRKTENLFSMLDALDNPQEEPVDENTIEDAGPAKGRKVRWLILKAIRTGRAPGTGIQKRAPAWRIPLRGCHSRSSMTWMWAGWMGSMVKTTGGLSAGTSINGS